MPRAILIGTGLVVALYLTLNLAYALALSRDDVRALVPDGKNMDALVPIAKVAAGRLYGQRISDPLSVAIGLTLLASVSAYVLTGPRVAVAMAHAGQFPSIAGRVTKRGAPVVATALQVGWALVLLWTASFERLVVYAGVGLAIFSMLTITCVYVLRIRRPDFPRPFRTPGYPVTPAIYLLGTALLIGAVIKERREVALYSIGSIILGVPVYYLWKAFTGPSKSP